MKPNVMKFSGSLVIRCWYVKVDKLYEQLLLLQCYIKLRRSDVYPSWEVIPESYPHVPIDISLIVLH